VCFKANWIRTILEKNSSLVALKLDSTYMDDSCALIVASGLKSNTTLSSLTLSDNQLGYSGALAFSNVIKSHQSLKSIDLGGNDLKPEGVRLLKLALAENPRIRHCNLEWGRS